MSDKKSQLRKHKAIATGLFLLMAMVYMGMLYTIKHHFSPWMEYVKAFSEAAMVGALADWFAVTALFKYPMGLKIPHTNLIENSKNKIGENLGTFVTENFLTSDTIRPYIEKIDLASVISKWMNQSKNQLLLEEELTVLGKKVIANLQDDSTINFLVTKANKGIKSLDLHGFASKGIMYALEKGEHNRLVDFILPKAQIYVEKHREDIYQTLIEKKPLLGLVGGKAITNQLINGINSFLQDIHQNPDHKLRQEMTLYLQKLATEIENSKQWKNKLKEILSQFITNDTIKIYLSDFWFSTKTTVLEQLDNKNSALRKYIQKNIKDIATNLESDQNLRFKINKQIQHSVYRLALKNIQEVNTLIQNTVQKWDGRELSNKLELEVGKDLQFIRINGTLVGGLVGLLIYIISNLLNLQ